MHEKIIKVHCVDGFFFTRLAILISCLHLQERQPWFVVWLPRWFYWAHHQVFCISAQLSFAWGLRNSSNVWWSNAIFWINLLGSGIGFAGADAHSCQSKLMILFFVFNFVLIRHLTQVWWLVNADFFSTANALCSSCKRVRIYGSTVHQTGRLGTYLLQSKTYNGHLMYKHESFGEYIYKDTKNGMWVVSDILGGTTGGIRAECENCDCPHEVRTDGWELVSTYNKWIKAPSTFRVICTGE